MPDAPLQSLHHVPVGRRAPPSAGLASGQAHRHLSNKGVGAGSRVNDVAAATLIRTLLSGGSPNGAQPEAFGKYQDVIGNLLVAYAAGGTAKIKEAWNGAV